LFARRKKWQGKSMSGRVEGRRPLPLRAAVVLAELHHIVVTRL
jgi:hypothetical protein